MTREVVVATAEMWGSRVPKIAGIGPMLVIRKGWFGWIKLHLRVNRFNARMIIMWERYLVPIYGCPGMELSF